MDGEGILLAPSYSHPLTFVIPFFSSIMTLYALLFAHWHHVLSLARLLLRCLLTAILFLLVLSGASSCFQVRKLAHKSLDPDNWAAELMRASKVNLACLGSRPPACCCHGCHPFMPPRLNPPRPAPLSCLSFSRRRRRATGDVLQDRVL